eukprot:NODE_167_length_16327_cov_0.361597.p9 type:complete len:109 gc:universal NODE_167_length_16327_cov_0.361597:3868-4194(+)
MLTFMLPNSSKLYVNTPLASLDTNFTFPIAWILVLTFNILHILSGSSVQISFFSKLYLKSGTFTSCFSFTIIPSNTRIFDCITSSTIRVSLLIIIEYPLLLIKDLTTI